jgi:hypothetical protein
MKGVKIGSYTYYKSTNPNKKLMTKVNNKTIHFGGNPNTSKHYFDKTGILNKSLNHNDEKIKIAWKKRHSKIKLKDGTFAYKSVDSPSYHSYNIIW